MEHESTTTIPVAPDRLYSALADVGSLTRLIPLLKSVRHTDPGHVDGSDVEQYVASTCESIRGQF
jgi:carbon monoxide dehydrogenase subunit G